MSLLTTRIAPRIVEEDGSFRTRMLTIAAGMTDIIALGRGDPDFHTPAHIVEAAKAALDANAHHYTGPTGLPALRQAIAADLTASYGLDYTADEIVVTAGVQESIMLTMLALCAPGDEVLITSPRFTTYDTAVHLCGGVPVPVPTYEKDDFALDVAEIEARITPRTRMFVLVSPNNPTGAVTPPAATITLNAAVPKPIAMTARQPTQKTSNCRAITSTKIAPVQGRMAMEPTSSTASRTVERVSTSAMLGPWEWVQQLPSARWS